MQYFILAKICEVIGVSQAIIILCYALAAINITLFIITVISELKK